METHLAQLLAQKAAKTYASATLGASAQPPRLSRLDHDFAGALHDVLGNARGSGKPGSQSWEMSKGVTIEPPVWQAVPSTSPVGPARNASAVYGRAQEVASDSRPTLLPTGLRSVAVSGLWNLRV